MVEHPAVNRTVAGSSPASSAYTGGHVPRGREALAMHLCWVRFPYSPI